MTPAKVKLFVAGFPYGGNGGISSEVPVLRHWFGKLCREVTQDERIGGFEAQDFSDTPITMTRCQAVLAAREAKADVLLMLDSDMFPDLYLGKDAFAQPFFKSSFDFMYERRKQGKISVVGAPYCGPPPEQVPYTFTWRTSDADDPDGNFQINLMTRDEAGSREGIHEVPCLATGLILYDMEIFDLTDPKHEYKRLLDLGQTTTVAAALTKPWFYYEYHDYYQANKCSTEDVTSTRDLGLAVQRLKGYNPLHCNFSSWAGHYKPWCVGKPRPITADAINEKYHAAVERGRESGEKSVIMRNGRLAIGAA